MVSRAPIIVTPSPVWENIARLASMRSKPLDLDACPTPTSLRRFCGATDKLKSTWFWVTNQKNRRGNFDAQITKPKLSVLRLKLGSLYHLSFDAQPRNPPPILRSNRKKPSLPVWCQTGENRRHWFWGQTRENRRAGFEVKQLETVVIGFKAQTNKKPSSPVLRPNRWKPSKWFWDQTTHKQSTLVLRLNQETRAPRLHVHGADRTRRHPTSRSSGQEYPTCVTITDPLHQIFYSWHDSHHCMSCHTCHLYTTRQANIILQKNKDKKNKAKLSRIQIQTSPNQWLVIIKLRNWPLVFSMLYFTWIKIDINFRAFLIYLFIWRKSFVIKLNT
jgi:hypothetical protein